MTSAGPSEAVFVASALGAAPATRSSRIDTPDTPAKVSDSSRVRIKGAAGKAARTMAARWVSTTTALQSQASSAAAISSCDPRLFTNTATAPIQVIAAKATIHSGLLRMAMPTWSPGRMSSRSRMAEPSLRAMSKVWVKLSRCSPATIRGRWPERRLGDLEQGGHALRRVAIDPQRFAAHLGLGQLELGPRRGERSGDVTVGGDQRLGHGC